MTSLDEVCRVIVVAQARAEELKKQYAAKIVIQYRTKENGKVLHGGIIWPSLEDLKARYPESRFTVTCIGPVKP